jgi:predicted extracellular nuclease
LVGLDRRRRPTVADGTSCDVAMPTTMAQRLTLSLALLHGALAQSCLVISGVIDGPLTGGLPKAIEVYATCAVADLSVYGLNSVNNGAGSTGTIEFTFPANAVAAGTFLYVATESPEFTAFFGFGPDFTNAAAPSINGDDAIELYKDGVVVDVFGDVDVDGTGKPWDYLDGWAYRKSGTGPDGNAFQLASWTFSGINALDNKLTNADPDRFPIGTYQLTAGASPSPSAPPSPPTSCTSIHTLQTLAATGTFGGQYLACAWVTRVVYNGFFIQEEPGADTSVSSGIFVFLNTVSAGVASGDAVQVLGTLGQFRGLNQLSGSPQVTLTGTAPHYFTPVSITVPVLDPQQLESKQGMLVSIVPAASTVLAVSEYFNLDRFGEFVACAASDADGRLFQFTARNAPDAAAYAAHVAELPKKCFVIVRVSCHTFPLHATPLLRAPLLPPHPHNLPPPSHAHPPSPLATGRQPRHAEPEPGARWQLPADQHSQHAPRWLDALDPHRPALHQHRLLPVLARADGIGGRPGDCWHSQP